MRLELNLDFEERFAKDRFFFGVAYAPYCEGEGLNDPDGPKNSDWARMDTPRTTPYEGIRFWTNYAEHVDLAASLDLNAFRMGIEWARCQPSASTEPTDPPHWDEAALDHYAHMVERVIDHGMQPIVTLHHFTHPLWLGVDIWQEDRGPDLMVDAQVHIVDEINQRLMARGNKRMSHFLVFNEPNIVPLIYHSIGWYPARQGTEYLLPAYDTMLSHYVKAYDGIHDLFETRGGARRTWASRSRACARTSTTSSSTTSSASAAGAWHARTSRPRWPSAVRPGERGSTTSPGRS